MPVTEQDFRDAGYDWICCDACHDDANMGWAEMPERQAFDGTWFYACCQVPPFNDEQIKAVQAAVEAHEEGFCGDACEGVSAHIEI